MNKILSVGILILVLFLAGVYFLADISYENRAIALENRAEAQQENLKSFYGQMWAIFQQQANVAEGYKDDFQEVYVEIMEGRYTNGSNRGQLMSWIQESNPNFDASMYRNLSNAIEAKRTEFVREQKKLLSIKEQHDNLRLQVPSRWFVSDDELEIQIITNQATEDAYRTGKEDVENLF